MCFVGWASDTAGSEAVYWPRNGALSPSSLVQSKSGLPKGSLLVIFVRHCHGCMPCHVAFAISSRECHVVWSTGRKRVRNCILVDLFCVSVVWGKQLCRHDVAYILFVFVPFPICGDNCQSVVSRSSGAYERFCSVLASVIAVGKVSSRFYRAAI